MKSISIRIPKSRPALALQGFLGLVLAYAIASRAIDTGSLWQYFFTFVFLVISIKLIIRSLRK